MAEQYEQYAVAPPESSRPLKVAYIAMDVSADGRPGPSDIVWDMARELVALGHEATVVAPEGTSSRAPRVGVVPFDVPPTGYRWFLGQLWLAWRIAAVIRSLDVDVVHAPEYLTSAVLTRVAPQLPVVLTVPGNIYQRLSVPGGNQASFLYTQTIKWAARRSARRCASVIAFTREMRDWWVRTGSSPGRTPIIPYGVDLACFSNVADARELLGVPAESLMLLYVGRLDREKGLFDAFAALAKSRDAIGFEQLRFDVVGAGSLSEVLKANSLQLGISQQVHFHGPVKRTELPLWYSAADALLLPSWIEPFGRVMLEAMACGTPVIATTTGGPVDHITPGENGYLFPPHDPEALAQLLFPLLTNPELLRSLRTRTSEYARSQLSWTWIVERVIAEVYQPIVDRPSSTAHHRVWRNEC